MSSQELSRLEHEADHHEEVLEDLGPDHDVEGQQGVHRVSGGWIRDATFGVNDGLVSVLTLLAGVAGAVEGDVVLLAGIAGLIAGAISMAVGAYVSAKAYRAYYRKELQREVREMRDLPEVEREEIRGIYRDRGFEGDLLERVVETITSNPRVWLKVMMSEELGLSAQFARPLGAAAVVFVAFVSGGIIPVVPFLFGQGLGTLAVAFGLTALALLAAGSIRSRFTGERPVLAGLELIGMATIGVGVAHGIGRLLDAGGLVG
ncbi:MAG: VIT1/CCC1 transporter family protein [Actinomycetota bacterium]